MRQMQWFNEPEQWNANHDQSLSMYVTPKTDFWRITNYGFTVDDGPFYYCNLGGEFEVAVRVTGEYKARYDQMGLMIRIDERNWIKTGVEYVNKKINLSAVVTLERSDWSIVELEQVPSSVWLKVIRRLDYVEIHYSLNNTTFTLLRLAYFPANTPVMVGMAAASPDGNGFQALFEDFRIKYLPDLQREQWLKENNAI
ncbi:DUF1349 domain-containing protein [Tunicatimonas pelagia]|uniref:DUF1349 domain-containing protein n=1 Tax=Tunicatimonas pelagia TaxID=931531 RepID=UPI0026668917|nr:DUF1349 domain-containing protein [Tunicatimonas pelagia]WKN43921.1 DUF1349 domain-containing protein [Tunicatimonas pelagia]